MSLALIRFALTLFEGAGINNRFAAALFVMTLGLFGCGASVGGLLGHGFGDRLASIVLGIGVGWLAVLIGFAVLLRLAVGDGPLWI